MELQKLKSLTIFKTNQTNLFKNNSKKIILWRKEH